MSELKPCPFCGNKDLTMRGGLRDQNNFHWIACAICGVSTRTAKTEGAAIAAWNKRKTKAQGSSVSCGECRYGIAVDESEQLILCDNPDMKEWHGKNAKHDRNCTCGYGVLWSSHNGNQRKKKSNFANGFNYFCCECGVFFSVELEPDVTGSAEFCPYCVDDSLITSCADLVRYCLDNDTDPVNFYKAFPPNEPIPGSRTGATPREVSIIIDLVAARKERKHPVTVESIAGPNDFLVDVVRKVFEELHITETGEKNAGNN